jgi:2-C-methyl-D-erythritol 2,4-cyclodiphosphate synthase
LKEEYRIGQGYDVHRLVKGRPLILGGVEIPFELGLDGHSDADVLCHAIGDAMLGAAALGDLGKHFPPSEPEWKDADSLKLLSNINHMVWKEGYQLVNVDSTLIMERPMVMKYCNQMRRVLADTLKIDVKYVSVKATTSEGLGYTGKSEGIAASAMVLIRK